MRLLVCTQAVDSTDPVLGFFHTWIVALASRAESVEVICLKKGDYDLPQNVQVHSLGKELGRASKMLYTLRFLRLVFKLRDKHDTVFVHMNQEYVFLAGWLWRLSAKRIVLWRNHKMGSVLTWVSCKLAHTVCYTSPSAYIASYRNAIRMPIGIDTDKFKIAEPKPHSVLFLGRLDPVKKPELFLEAVERLDREGVDFHADVYGDPTHGNDVYAQRLKERFAKLKSVTFHSGVRNDETPAIYAAHTVYVNLTPSGSFDKTIGEAMAAGCVVVVSNEAVRGVIPERFIVKEISANAVAQAIKHALELSDEERMTVAEKSREYIELEHSLSLLGERLFEILLV